MRNIWKLKLESISDAMSPCHLFTGVTASMSLEVRVDWPTLRHGESPMPRDAPSGDFHEQSQAIENVVVITRALALELRHPDAPLVSLWLNCVTTNKSFYLLAPTVLKTKC